MSRVSVLPVCPPVTRRRQGKGRGTCVRLSNGAPLPLPSRLSGPSCRNDEVPGPCLVLRVDGYLGRGASETPDLQDPRDYGGRGTRDVIVGVLPVGTVILNTEGVRRSVRLL